MDVLKLIVRLRKFKSGYMCSNNLSEINISQLTEWDSQYLKQGEHDRHDGKGRGVKDFCRVSSGDN